MLSILIPIYNRDSTELVTELQRQGNEANLEFEIICLDDCSREDIQVSNRSLKSISNVHYEELETNVGRSRIRNLMAEKARYDSLMFIDCDMSVSSNTFISKYIDAVNGAGVVVGGLKYDENPPHDPELTLRWVYGCERESNTLEKRLTEPYASFMTGVFLIDKDSFNAIKFDESISRYGHEDTLFGAELNAKGIDIKHIDNPLTHKGLEKNEDFIAKTEVAIQTLSELVKSGKIQDDVRLYRVYKQLKRFYLHNLFARRFHNRKDKWLENLYSTKPDLNYFDMYRLGYLCTLLR